MMKLRRAIPILGMVAALAACQDLDVENVNGPDRDRALGTPEDVESFIGGAFRVWWFGTSNYDPAWALTTAADENSSSWGNYGMRDISSEPRTAYQNSTGYGYNEVNEEPWYDMYEAISNVNEGLVALNGGLAIEQDGRARAFAKFIQGLSHGFLALMFDQAFIYTEEQSDLAEAQFELVPYTQVMDAAIAMLEQSIALSDANDFTLPAGWLAGLELSNDELSRLAHSYAARYMAAVARTPAERAAVDWNAVIAHIDQGVTEDFAPISDDDVWWSFYLNYIQRFDWFRVDYWTIGKADNSGAFEAWKATPVGERVPFDIVTADRRVHDPDMDCSAIPRNYGDDDEVGVVDCGKYFYYRATANFRADRGTYHFSRYGFSRYIDYRGTWLGPMPALTVSEMDLLKAEALLRSAGNTAAAAQLINKTRVGNGELPPAQASESVEALMEKMIYEKAFETMGIADLAFFDKRGWGLLKPGTPLHFPMPARELETLQMPIYTFGGGGDGSAP